MDIQVSSEVENLRKLLIHSPDAGIGNIIPNKAQEWLYEDIVDLRRMRNEYDVYKKILLAYLDMDTLKKWFEQEEESPDTDTERADFKKPSHPNYLESGKVIEIQRRLAEILKNQQVRTQLVASICAIERCSHQILEKLLDKDKINEHQLAKTLITGRLQIQSGNSGKYENIFPPTPNLIFTRDIGVVIDKYLILSKTAKRARLRESLLAKYIAYYDPIFFRNKPGQVIEITEDDNYFLYDENELNDKIVTLEGGDLMMIAKGHLLVGCSERTSHAAIDKMIKRLFELRVEGSNEKVLYKITVIIIPKQRGTMHIDTIFTQVKRDTWLLFGPLSKRGKEQTTEYNYDIHMFNKKQKIEHETEQLKIIQFINEKKRDEKQKVDRYINDSEFDGLEDLMERISRDDFKCNGEINFIYCGNKEYPHSEREQWSDACNVLALKEGVVLGYDRNYKTIDAFMKKGFSVKKAENIIGLLKDEWKKNPKADLSKYLLKIAGKDMMITLPSAELSRARGGAHCMSLPLHREGFD
jgi:arginine deiminase